MKQNQKHFKSDARLCGNIHCMKEVDEGSVYCCDACEKEMHDFVTAQKLKGNSNRASGMDLKWSTGAL